MLGHSSNSNKNPKRSQAAVHRLPPTTHHAPHPPQATNLPINYPALTVPSHQFSPFDNEHYYANAGHKAQTYQFDVVNSNLSAHPVVPNVNPPAPPYQQQHPHHYPGQPTSTNPYYMPPTNQPSAPTVPIAPSTTTSGYYPAPPNVPSSMGMGNEKSLQSQWSEMSVDKLSPSPALSPSELAESYSYLADSKHSVDENQGTSDERKRIRDPRRKEIEGKAAEKRKAAVKRLSHVLANRTHGLPENGLANQLHMAADQLEDDGRVIANLRKENGELRKENATIRKELQQARRK